MFHGSIVALVTPFSGGKLDLKALKRLVSFHLDNGTHGIVPCGTTGEASTLSSEERTEVIKTVIKVVKGRIPVIAGTGTNDTRTTIEHTRSAERLGADGALVVTPYYNKPTQQGMFLHFEAVAKCTSMPIVLYNVPGRTSVSLAPETVARLSAIPNITAIKESSGSVETSAQIASLCDITILSGEDSLTLPLMSIGATGIISVTANVYPAEVASLTESFANCNLAKTRKLYLAVMQVSKAMFIETNPIPVKTALAFKKMIKPEFRLPLCPMSADNAKKLKAAMDAFEKTSY